MTCGKTNGGTIVAVILGNSSTSLQQTLADSSKNIASTAFSFLSTFDRASDTVHDEISESTTKTTGAFLLLLLAARLAR